MFKKILVPVDGSDTSDQAVQLAISVARDQGAELIFCHALPVAALIAATSAPPIDPTFAIEETRRYGQSILGDAVARASAAGVKASSVLAEDDPIPTIMRLVKEMNPDLVVLGTHGRHGFARAVMGSTTEGVMRQSPVPVLAVRHKDAKVQ